MIAMKQLLDAMNAAGASNRVLFADCCREDPSVARGALLAGRAFGSNVRISDLAEGTAALFSCSAAESAFEHPSWGHGALTKAFLDYCQNLSSQNDSTINSMTAPLYRQVGTMVRLIQPGAVQRVNPVINGVVDLKLRLTPKLPERISNSLGMQLQLIKSGEFVMGTDHTRDSLENVGFVLPDNYVDELSERPKHPVSITRSFYLGVHEVTRGQFAEFIRATGYRTDAEKDGQGGEEFNDTGDETRRDPQFSWRNPGFPQTDHHPVVNVTWHDAMEFCEWLSRVEGQPYRLPVEAEWEYACRAGANTHFSTGDSPASLQGFANVYDESFEGLSELAFPFDDRFKCTAPVGSYRPNNWGLHDMHGNVRELCADQMLPYETTALVDPGFTLSSGAVSVRGGSFHNSPARTRAAYRHWCNRNCSHCTSGFRVAVGATRDRVIFSLAYALETLDADRFYRVLDEFASVESSPEDQEQNELLRVSAIVALAAKYAEAGRAGDGIAELRSVENVQSSQLRQQVLVIKAALLANEKRFSDVEVELATLNAFPDSTPEILNQIAWMIVEAAEAGKTNGQPIPMSTIQAAAALAETAARKAPQDGSILDTLAHFQYLTGKLEEAIETQKSAVAKSGAVTEESRKAMTTFLEQLLQEKASK
jgi:formylglycine-generating enzyme required for sulfatase activity